MIIGIEIDIVEIQIINKTHKAQVIHIKIKDYVDNVFYQFVVI